MFFCFLFLFFEVAVEKVVLHWWVLIYSTYYKVGFIWKKDLNEGRFQLFRVIYLEVRPVSVRKFLRYINQCTTCRRFCGCLFNVTGVCMLLVRRLDFMILLFVMHIMSKFRLKLESRSFSSLIWELSEEMLGHNTAKSCFDTITLLKSLKS